MRNQTFPRVSAARNVCLFCTHRVVRDAPIPSRSTPYPQRRHLKSSSTAFQQAASAEKYEDERIDHQKSQTSSWGGAGWGRTFSSQGPTLNRFEQQAKERIHQQMGGTNNTVESERRSPRNRSQKEPGTFEERKTLSRVTQNLRQSSTGIFSKSRVSRVTAGASLPGHAGSEHYEESGHSSPFCSMQWNKKTQDSLHFKPENSVPGNKRDKDSVIKMRFGPDHSVRRDNENQGSVTRKHLRPGQRDYRLNMNIGQEKPPDAEPFDTQLISQWRHLKLNRPPPPLESQQVKQDLTDRLRRAKTDDRHQRYAEERDTRERHSRDKSFVGFRNIERESPVPNKASEKTEEGGTVIYTPNLSKNHDDWPPKFRDQPNYRTSDRTSDRTPNRMLPVRFERTANRFVKMQEELPQRRDRDNMRRRDKFAFDFEEEFQAREEENKKKEKKKERRKAKHAEAVAHPTPIFLPQYISVSNLAAALRVRFEDFVRKLEELGFEDVQSDHVLNAENAGLVAMEYNFEPVVDESEDRDLHAAPVAEDRSEIPLRPPVVTIMGHVDHGKTTILDYLRKSSVAATEFGGITQHIGAFSVALSSGKTITFLDTPGHAAFLNMRQRGANVTDIVVLVVAADDSVMPQTLEAIKHAQAARVPIIVAINKIDKPEAAPERVKHDLARHGIEVEDFGGDTQVVAVSGKTGQGIKDLEGAISLQSEILDHRAETDGPVEGWVLEATTKKSGRVATVLVRRGNLKQGDILVAGTTWTRVRTLRNEGGITVNAVGPGMPVEVDGWEDQPDAGDEVLEAPDEQKAKDVVDWRIEKEERVKLAKDMEAINEARKAEQEKRERGNRATAAGPDADADQATSQDVAASSKRSNVVPFILKADVSGSAEAVHEAISTLGNNEVWSHILRSGVGGVSEFDVEHAAAARGHILAFNTTAEPRIRQMAEVKGVEIIEDNVIYRLVNTVKAKLSEKLAPLVTQKVTGEAEVAQVFEISLGGRKKNKIAGCKVRYGVVGRGNRVRVQRRGEQIYDGTITSLKNVKKDVSEMRKGTECGIGFENWEAFKEGDKIQTYEEMTEKRYL
ncbi:initiation factor 2 [Patellaria atrata CBS 101060]|uniref:Translation initiation factor IF-2, mitochondrial n=1 Tax=Patellaria atrata CBS 101060 TaxID=1346257 RepID=A0A9P4S9L3_9PEZI|nr:initiation factor 2 [Patellaria atrata CBS 101060]